MKRIIQIFPVMLFVFFIGMLTFSCPAQGDEGDLVYQRYGIFLKAFGEQSIYAEKENKDIQVYRFTWLRTFHFPILIKLKVNKANSLGTLHIKELDGASGYDYGKIRKDYKKEVSKENVDKLLQLLKRTNFWKLTPEIEDMGLDGAWWIVEGLKDGKYHFVKRWSPKNDVKDIGLFFLQLTDLKVEQIY